MSVERVEMLSAVVLVGGCQHCGDLPRAGFDQT